MNTVFTTIIFLYGWRKKSFEAFFTCLKNYVEKTKTFNWNSCFIFVKVKNKTLTQFTLHSHTHKFIRRSYSTLKSTLPNMFHYLHNANIPHTTNGIEGFFSHLKNHLDIHRGLTVKNRINFIKWYINFTNNE